jgi:hypothetical protein
MEYCDVGKDTAMAIFPKVQNPCPYKGNLSEVMDGDFCRKCEKQVHEITDWTDDQRLALLHNSPGEVCVSYKLPVGTAIAAAAIAAAAMGAPTAAFAQQQGGVGTEVVELIMVGGIKDPANVEMVQAPEDAATPELPVVYEAEAPAATASAPDDLVPARR